MTEDNEFEAPIVVAGENYDEHLIAEGVSEFSADPSGIMNFIPMDDAPTKNFMQQLTETNTTSPLSTEQAAVMMPDRAGNTEIMSDLIRRMHGDAEQVIDTALRDPDLGPPLQRALITESFKDDEWRIQMNESAMAGKYKIINTMSARSFFDDITLLEAAKKIVKFLDENHSVNSKSIQQILYYDKVYENQYNECQNFKRLHKAAKRNGNAAKMNLMASKFDHAKGKAREANKSIKSL